MIEEKATPTVYTIGHSNHAQEMFLALLQQHDIDILVDVRSRPHSRFVPHFDPGALQPAVTQCGRQYLFQGRELGGRPEGAQFYDEERHARYDRVAATDFFREGLERLEKGLLIHRIAMMCSEEDPTGCHRRLLVARVLAERGVQVIHIRGDGSLQTETELQATLERAEMQATGGQRTLFDEEENTPWKSLKPIPSSIPSGLRKRRRGNSSKL